MKVLRFEGSSEMTFEVASVLVDVVVFFLCAGIFPPCGNGNEETKGRSMPVLLPLILLFGKASLYTQLGMASTSMTKR